MAGSPATTAAAWDSLRGCLLINPPRWVEEDLEDGLVIQVPALAMATIMLTACITDRYRQLALIFILRFGCLGEKGMRIKKH